MNKHVDKLMWFVLGVFFTLLLTSCSTLEIAGVGRPDPNLKTVHFIMTHWGEDYTQEDYESHPDHDCNGTINYKNKQDESKVI